MAKELPLVSEPPRVPSELKVNTNGLFVKLNPGTLAVPDQVVLLRSGGETGSGELFLQELASNAIDVIATKTNFFMICVLILFTQRYPATTGRLRVVVLKRGR